MPSVWSLLRSVLKQPAARTCNGITRVNTTAYRGVLLCVYRTVRSIQTLSKMRSSLDSPILTEKLLSVAFLIVRDVNSIRLPPQLLQRIP